MAKNRIAKKVVKSSLKKQSTKRTTKPKTVPTKKSIAIQEKIMSMFGKTGDKSKALSYEMVQIGTGQHKGIVNYAISELTTSKQIVSLTDPNGSTVYLLRNIFQKEGSRKDDITAQSFYSPDDLPNLINKKYYDKIGSILIKKTKTGNFDFPATEAAWQKIEDEVDMPKEYILIAIDTYVKHGLLKYVSAKSGAQSISRTASTKDNTNLSFDNIVEAGLSVKYVLGFSEKKGPKSMSDIKKYYEAHNTMTKMKTIELSYPDRDDIMILPLAEVLFGNQELDVEFLQRIIDHHASAKRKPEVILIAGLVQGQFQHVEKNRRRTLVKGMNKTSQQFAAAKILLDKLKAAFPESYIIYNMTDDDIVVCENYAYTALDNMRKRADGVNTDNSSTKQINYYQQDLLKRDASWDFHMWFQVHVVFQYMLLTGRSLRGAQEMDKLGKGYVEEYSYLIQAFEELNKTGVVSAETRSMLAADIPIFDIDSDRFYLAHDFNLEVTLSGGEVKKVFHKHNFEFSAKTMKADPTAVLKSMIGQTSQEGKKLPDLILTSGQMLAQGVTKEDLLVMSLPGMMHQKISRTSFYEAQDFTRRAGTSRKQLLRPGVTPIYLNKGHDFGFSVETPHFMDKMHISKDRVVVVLLSDFQIGSWTARPDLLVKFMSYVFFELMKNHKVHLFFNGDHIQGNNYPMFYLENLELGLTSIDNQIEMLQFIFRTILQAVPKENWKNLVGVDIQPGNHEWNSSYVRTGSMHINWMNAIFQEMKRFHGLDFQINSRYNDKIMFKGKGDHFKFNAVKREIAGYNFLVQHLLLEKGAKGVTGSPVGQGNTLIDGLGSALAGVDFTFSGHWHHFMYKLIANMMYVINGSIASTSGYEFVRGHRPIISQTLMSVGGGLPPYIRVVTEDTMSSLITQGAFSDEALKKKGFVTDKGFDPKAHGFYRLRNTRNGQIVEKPSSAIQKALQDMQYDMLWGEDTTTII